MRETSDLELKIATANAILVCALYVISTALDLMILFAYYKLSQKLTKEASKMVAHSLQ